ncbi:MAG: hypothetical protein ACR2L0_00770 [Gaiellaceae bacterium]
MEAVHLFSLTPEVATGREFHCEQHTCKFVQLFTRNAREELDGLQKVDDVDLTRMRGCGRS